MSAATLNNTDAHGGSMDDLTATRLCAEAMDLLREVMQRGKVHPVRMGSSVAPVEYYEHLSENGMILKKYDPLHDDAQAMALVKRFRLNVESIKILWQAKWMFGDGHGVLSWKWQYGPLEQNLNRAIVYCVAQMRAAK